MSAPYIVTMTGRNRVGVIRDISATILKLEGNVEAIRQVILEEYFSVILRVVFPDSTQNQEVQRAFDETFSGEFPSAVVAKVAEKDDVTDLEHGGQFVLTVNGTDSPGTLHKITECLVGEGINILNLWGSLDGGQTDLVFWLNVPERVNASDINDKLHSLFGSGSLIYFRHQEVFDAANQIFWRYRSSRSGGK